MAHLALNSGVFFVRYGQIPYLSEQGISDAEQGRYCPRSGMTVVQAGKAQTDRSFAWICLVFYRRSKLSPNVRRKKTLGSAEE